MVCLSKLKIQVMFVILTTRGRVTVARKAHNLEVVGSIPTPATLRLASLAQCKLFCIE